MMSDMSCWRLEVHWIYEIDGRILARIEHDAAAGFYLHIFDAESGASTHDHLQDTLEIAMEQAEEEYGLVRASWKPAEAP